MKTDEDRARDVLEEVESERDNLSGQVGELKALTADLQETNGLLNANLSKTRASLRDLLARIHRDGGHYTEDHGEDVSIRHAHEKVAFLLSVSDLAHKKREP